MASQTWLLSDPDRTVVSGRPISVPGGRRTRHGWLTEVRLPSGNRLGRHGNLLAGRVVTVFGLGLLCAVLTVADLLVPARVACLALLVAFAWTGIAYRRTNRLAALVRGAATSSPAATLSPAAGSATGRTARPATRQVPRPRSDVSARPASGPSAGSASGSISGPASRAVAHPAPGPVTPSAARPATPTSGPASRPLPAPATLPSASPTTWPPTDSISWPLSGRIARAARRLFARPAGVPSGSVRPGADDVHVLTALEDRDDLHRGLRLAERIWADRATLHLGDDTARLLGNAVRDLAAVLARRQRLREIWDGIDRHDDAGLPHDSPAVLAAREQGERADALWAELNAEVALHLEALRAAAESGASLLREIALGDAARRTRVALDEFGAPAAPAPVSGLGAEAYTDAYRDLAARYGRDLYS